MNPSEYAQSLIKRQKIDGALKIAENCESLSKNLMMAEEVPAVGEEVEVTEESYKDKNGNMQTRERIKVDRVLQNKRLTKSASFWNNVASIVRKAKAREEQKKNTQS